MKKILIGLGATATALAMVPLFAAFEAHVINVTARIENALSVPVQSLDFGTVFPQEKLDKFFDVTLSQSFQDEDRVDDVEYIIRQKPKCQRKDSASTDLPPFGQVTEDGQGNFVCVDPQNYELMPLLCPYLSKHEVTTDGSEQENDEQPGISAFHGPIDLAQWTLNVAKSFDIKGRLVKAGQDFSDTWNIDLKVPCFGDYCAQDWAAFVAANDGDNDADPDAYVQPIENEHKIFGCDLWLEVTGISLPGIGCVEKADVMLVLDRSGSIDSGELATLKTAAKAFVDALGPATDGVHMGQSSFSSSGSLDLHLNDDSVTIKAAIDALVNGGTTHLEDGILLATGELANPGDGHDRADGESPDFMVIITDGQPNQCNGVGCDPEDAAKAAADAAKAAGVEIFVVGVGTTPSTADFLKNNIASGTDHYFDAADFDDLQAILDQIASCNND